MHRKLWLFVLLSAILLSAGSEKVHGDYYVIGRVGTKITSLPSTISQSGFYYLGGNLTYSGDSNAITITADNVTLDLMGFSLTCTGTSGNLNGVYINGRKNLEVRNGTLRGFWTGIYEENSFGANHRIINVRADNNTIVGAWGIYLLGNDHLVKGCTASQNQSGGIYVNSGTITGSVACDNGIVGIKLPGSGSVIGNVANNSSSTGTTGFDLGYGNIVVDQNTANGNGTNYFHGPSNSAYWGINAGR
jgi:hypothetical protein